MNKVRKDKLERVRRNLLNKKSIRRSMLEAGYKEKTANRGMANKVCQEALNQINLEFKNKVTVEMVLKRINEDRKLALKKKDYATALRADELLGKYLAMFIDKTEIKHKLPTDSDKSILARYGLVGEN